METTITLGVGALLAAAGTLAGAALGFGMVRGKLSEVERLTKALFKKLDELAGKHHNVASQQARDDERIKALASDVKMIRTRLPTGPISIEVPE